MNENLKSKITGKLDAMPDETGRQLLDYLEFLESKHHRSIRSPSTVQKIAENIEDRIGSVSLTEVATKGGAQVMEAAGKLMDGLAAASRVVAEELQPPESPEDGNGQEPAAPPADPDATEGEKGTA
jgi:hypothetical protein